MQRPLPLHPQPLLVLPDSHLKPHEFSFGFAHFHTNLFTTSPPTRLDDGDVQPHGLPSATPTATPVKQLPRRRPPRPAIRLRRPRPSALVLRPHSVRLPRHPPPHFQGSPTYSTTPSPTSTISFTSPNDHFTVTSTFTPTPGVDFLKTVSESTANPGDILTYSLTLDVTGDPVTNLSVTDVLPAAMDLVGFGSTPPGGVNSWNASLKTLGLELHGLGSRNLFHFLPSPGSGSSSGRNPDGQPRPTELFRIGHSPNSLGRRYLGGGWVHSGLLPESHQGGRTGEPTGGFRQGPGSREYQGLHDGLPKDLRGPDPCQSHRGLFFTIWTARISRAAARRTGFITWSLRPLPIIG